MDIWGNIYVGKRWVEDDGSQGCEIQNSKEWHVKTSMPIRVDVGPQFKEEWARIGEECARLIAMQMMQIRDELLYLAKHGIDRKGGNSGKKEGPEKQDTGTD